MPLTSLATTRRAIGRTAAAGALAALALSVTACADQGEPDDPGSASPDQATSSSSVQSLRRDLAPGDEGADVRAVHTYFRQYGYLPNAEIARERPRWRPLLERAPENDYVFDAQTAEAVLLLQRQFRLEQTGVVDAATRGVLQQARCGYPEGLEAPRRKDAQKYAIWAEPWPSTISWTFGSQGATLPRSQLLTAMRSVYATWAQATSLTFVEDTSGLGLFQVFFSDTLFAGFLGGALAPPSHNLVQINTSFNFSTATPTPATAYDFNTVVLHETGHSLGLHHSWLPTAVMFATLDRGAQRRTLTDDDRIALSLLYDRLQGLSTTSLKDIAVSPTDEGWAIDAATNRPLRWNGSSWTSVGTISGARISVGSDRRPWVVAQNGNIYRLASAGGSTWTLLPGCARDIGVGGNGSVWVIGCVTVPGGNSIHRWNGSNWVASDGGAVRIAVAPNGAPIVVNSAGGLYRRNADNPTAGQWTFMQSPSAADVSVDATAAIWIADQGGIVWAQNAQSGVGLTDTWTLDKWEDMRDSCANGPCVDNLAVSRGAPWVTSKLNGRGFRSVR